MNLPVDLGAASTQTVVVSSVLPPKRHYLDCRSCKHRYRASVCEAPTKCEDGNQFSPLPPIQLWKTV